MELSVSRCFRLLAGCSVYFLATYHLQEGSSDIKYIVKRKTCTFRKAESQVGKECFLLPSLTSCIKGKSFWLHKGVLLKCRSVYLKPFCLLWAPSINLKNLNIIYFSQNLCSKNVTARATWKSCSFWTRAENILRWSNMYKPAIITHYLKTKIILQNRHHVL